MALTQFETEEDYNTPLNVMVELVLPILDQIQQESADECELVSSLKDQWVRLLDENITGNCYFYFQQFNRMLLYVTCDIALYVTGHFISPHLDEKMDAINNFITRLFEPAPASSSINCTQENIEVPMDIGNRYKQVMAAYWASIDEANISE